MCVWIVVSSMEMESWSPRHAQFQSSHSTLQHCKYEYVSSQRHFLCAFCYSCLARDYTACLRWSACFTICSHLTNPPNDLRPPNASIYKYLAQSAPSAMQGYLMQSTKHVGIGFGYLLTPTFDMLILPLTIPHVFLLFALLHYFFLLFYSSSNTDKCYFALAVMCFCYAAIFIWGKKKISL